MKALALAVLVAMLAGCAVIVPPPPPLYVGIHARGGWHY